MNKLLFILAALTFALMFCASAVFGQEGSRTWTGALDNDFYNSGNWTINGNGSNFPNGNASFSGTTTNNNIARTSGTYNYLYGLYFNNTVDTQSAFTIGLTPNSGTQINWGGPVIRTTAMTNGTLTDTINSNVALVGSAAKEFQINDGHNLTINGNITGGNTTDFTFTKNGTGILTLAGTNAYNVETTVAAGILKVDNASALGSTSAGTVVNGGATLQLDHNGAMSETITINGAGDNGNGALWSTGGPANNGPDLSGVITLGSDATIRTDTRIDHSKQITDGGNGFTLTKTGTGSFVTGQQQNYSNLVVNEGEWLTTAPNGLPNGVGTTVTVNSGANLTLWGAQAPTDVNLTLNDGSFYNANHNTAGTVSSIDGVVSVDGNVTMRSWSNDHTINSDISGTGNITVISYINNFDDAKFTFAGNNTYSGITTVGDADGGNGKMTLELSGVNTGGGNYVINTESSLVVSATQAQTLTGVISGSGSILQTGIGTLTLNGANTYTGGTKLGLASGAAAGTVSIEDSNALGTGSFEYEAGGTLNLGVDGLSIGNTIRVLNRSDTTARIIKLDHAGANAGTLTGIVDLRLSQANNFIVDVGTDDMLTMSGNIVNQAGGGVGITKEGAGTLVVSGTNTYSGKTDVFAGTLLINGVNTAAGNVTVASGATLGGTGTVGGFTVVSAGGSLAPGASIGDLKINNDVNLDGNLDIEFDGTMIDSLTIVGDFNIGSGAVLNFANIGADLSLPGYVFATYTGSRTGSFSTITGTPTGYAVQYVGNSVVLTAVPEPGAALLLCFGMGGVFLRRRRR